MEPVRFLAASGRERPHDRRTAGSVCDCRLDMAQSVILARRTIRTLLQPQEISAVLESRVTFAAHIPLYASCQAVLIGDTDLSPVPIRQFHGAADDYVPVAPCRQYFERLRAAGRDMQLTEYPDAHHGYDKPLGDKTPTVAKRSQSVRACKLKEEPLGTIINAETGQAFTYRREKVT